MQKEGKQSNCAEEDEIIKSSFLNNQQNSKQISKQRSQDQLLEACQRRRQGTFQSIKEAIRLALEAINEYNSPEAYYLLAEAYQQPQMEQMEDILLDQKIVQCYEKAIQKDPIFQPAYYMLAKFYEGQNQWVNALKTYEKWSLQFPKKSRIYGKMGDIFKMTEKHEEAAKLYAISMASTDKDRIDRGNFSLEEEKEMIYYIE